jgi:hypothetical protein
MGCENLKEKEMKVGFIIADLRSSGNLSKRGDIWWEGANEFLANKKELSEILSSLKEKGYIKCDDDKIWKLT